MDTCTKCAVELNLHMAMRRKTKPATKLMQVRDYFILTIIWGFSPLLARKTIELCGLDSLTWLQPQCVSRSKLNLRGRNFLQSKATAATPTIPRNTIFCQSTVP